MGIIYCATNLTNGKKYIGQTSNTLKYRMQQHKSAAKAGRKSKFCNAIRKYGVNGFLWEIIWKCQVSQLNCNESFFIYLYDTMESGYNSTLGGEGTRGHIASEDHRKKISIGNKGKYVSPETRAKIAIGNTGIKFSKERCEAISRAKKGKKRDPESVEAGAKKRRGIKVQFSEQHKENMYNSGRNRIRNPIKKVRCIDTGEVFQSISSAAKKYGAFHSSLGNHLAGKTKHFRNMQWEVIID